MNNPCSLILFVLINLVLGLFKLNMKKRVLHLGRVFLNVKVEKHAFEHNNFWPELLTQSAVRTSV